MSDKPESVRELRTLGNYAYPAMPTRDWLRDVRDRFVSIWSRSDDAPFITSKNLRYVPTEILDRFVPEPRYGPVGRDLDSALGKWLDEERATASHRIVIFPPCDDCDILRHWAEQHNLTCFAEPARHELRTCFDASASLINIAEPLAIPRLERWFLRDRDGLSHVRELLKTIHQRRHPTLLGCNSWAWQFLSKAAGVNIVLPQPLMFQPFGAPELFDWFKALAIDDGEKHPTERITLRLAANGRDIFARSLSRSAAVEALFESLAAVSLGIPWVAWQIWHESLRRAPDEDEEDAGRNALEDDYTLWLSELSEVELPLDDERTKTILFILHALLLHGGLTTDELRTLVPHSDREPMVTLLKAHRVIERYDDRWICATSAYPAVRQALVNAGFPSDIL